MNEIKQKHIKEISIQYDDTIINALKKMDSINKKLLLVYKEEHYINLLSIGDIQRAIIKNKSFDDPINEILRENVLVSKKNESIDEIKTKMIHYRAECMPVIGDDGSLIDIYFWEDFFREEQRIVTKKLDIPAVIMAGGFGTRLKPLTNVIPKPLVPIGEKPIMENIIDRFCNIGVSDFHVTVNYKHEMIKFYFDSIKDKEYNISYHLEDKPLGTAGSLYLLRDIIKTTFFINNCDIIIDQDYSEIYDYHRNNNNDITIVAAVMSYSIPYGILESKQNGLLANIKEKPDLTFLINSGMYILEPDLLHEIPENTFYHITDLIEQVRTNNGRVGVFPVSEKSWFDIGEWEQYRNTVVEYERRYIK